MSAPPPGGPAGRPEAGAGLGRAGPGRGGAGPSRAEQALRVAPPGGARAAAVSTVLLAPSGPLLRNGNYESSARPLGPPGVRPTGVFPFFFIDF